MDTLDKINKSNENIEKAEETRLKKDQAAKQDLDNGFITQEEYEERLENNKQEEENVKNQEQENIKAAVDSDTSLGANTNLGKLLCLNTKGNDPVNGIFKALATYISTYVIINGNFTGTMGVSVLNCPTVSKIISSPLSSEKVMCQDPKGATNTEPVWKNWIIQVYSKIMMDTTVMPGAFIPSGTINPWIALTQPGWTQEDLKKAFENNKSNPQGPVMDEMAKGIMKDLQSATTYIPTIPGVVGGYVGTTVVLNIVCP